MAFNNGLFKLRNVFDLSALSLALEEVILPQAGRLAKTALSVFDLSSLARALDEDIESQTARFTATVSNAFDLSPLSRALDEDIAANTARPVIPVTNAFNLAMLGQALDEDLATQFQNTEQHEVIALNPAIAVTTSPIPVNVSDPPTISARRAEKLPVKDSLRKRKLDAAGSVEYPTHTPNRKRKLNDPFEPFGQPAKKCKHASIPESLVAPPNRKLSDAFQHFGPPAKTRKHTNGPKSPVGPAKRRLSNAFESFSLPAKKRKHANAPESRVDPALPLTIKCETAISALVDPLLVKKRKRDDAIELSDPRKRRRQGAPLPDDVAQFTPFPMSLLPAGKREDIEEFAPGTTSTPVKQQAAVKDLIDERFNDRVEEYKENFVPLDPLPVKKRKRDDANEPSETKAPRKRRRQGDAPLSNDVAQPALSPTSPLPARKQEDIEEFAPGATPTPVKQQADVEEPIDECFNGLSVELASIIEELNVCNNGEADVDTNESTECESDVVGDDEAWHELYLQLCREVFGDGEDSDEEAEPCTQPRNDLLLAA